MKKIIVLALVMGVFVAGRAQTFDEWFEQKKTQIRYLKAQIAALAEYEGVTAKGYTIAQDGTDAISGIKQVDLQLHSDYFSSLRTVNPAIRGSPEVAGTIRLAGVIAEVAAEIGDAEVGLLADCAENVDLLEMLVTDGQVEMTDAERIKAIDILYARMRRLLQTAIAIRDQIGLLHLNLSS
ncbi:MAG TPA: hypothetical protein VKQ52_16670 [Puia sp.]|nr:hypothetical protein [Puia sp.]